MQQELEYIYQVYLDRNFSKAAERLYISQPALSMAIRKVEEGLGMPIFDRSTRPLSLTPAGQAYIDFIQKQRFLEQDLQKEIDDISELRTGKIRMGGSHYLNAYILPEILAGFTRKYPNIEIEIVENSSAGLSAMLAERELDLTFNCNPKFMLDFERYPVFCDNVLLAVPREFAENAEVAGCALTAEQVSAGKHLQADCPTVPLGHFREVPFLRLTKGNNLHDRTNQLFEEAGFDPVVRMNLKQLVTAYHLADAGLGAAFISDRLVVRKEDRLYYYKLDSELTMRQFYILLPRNKYTSYPVRAFIQYFTEKLQDKADDVK